MDCSVRWMDPLSIWRGGKLASNRKWRASPREERSRLIEIRDGRAGKGAHHLRRGLLNDVQVLNDLQMRSGKLGPPGQKRAQVDFYPVA